MHLLYLKQFVKLINGIWKCKGFFLQKEFSYIILETGDLLNLIFNNIIIIITTVPFQKNCIRKQYLKLWTLSFLLSCNRLWDSEDVLQGLTVLRSGLVIAICFKASSFKAENQQIRARSGRTECISRGQTSVTKL